jgi:GNAT superfamily N-acetyltransferase
MDAPRIAALIAMGAFSDPLSPDDAALEGAHPDYLTAFDDVVAAPGNALFVAEQSGQVIGTFQVTVMPGLAGRRRRRAKFESVHVDPAYRGQGIGKIMIAAAIAHAKEQGAGLIELSSNKSRVDAHRFYRNLGFVQSHEGFKLMLE